MYVFVVVVDEYGTIKLSNFSRSVNIKPSSMTKKLKSQKQQENLSRKGYGDCVEEEEEEIIFDDFMFSPPESWRVSLNQNCFKKKKFREDLPTFDLFGVGIVMLELLVESEALSSLKNDIQLLKNEELNLEEEVRSSWKIGYEIRSRIVHQVVSSLLLQQQQTGNDDHQNQSTQTNHTLSISDHLFVHLLSSLLYPKPWERLSWRRNLIMKKKRRKKEEEEKDERSSLEEKIGLENHPFLSLHLLQDGSHHGHQRELFPLLIHPQQLEKIERYESDFLDLMLLKDEIQDHQELLDEEEEDENNPSKISSNIKKLYQLKTTHHLNNKTK